jgi:hypothetical protein
VGQREDGARQDRGCSQAPSEKLGEAETDQECAGVGYKLRNDEIALSRVFGGYLFIIVLLSALFCVLIRSDTPPSYRQPRGRPQNAGISLRMTVTSCAQKQFDELNGLVRSLAKEENIRITVVDPQGVVVADSEENPQGMENHRGRPKIAGLSAERRVVHSVSVVPRRRRCFTLPSRYRAKGR